MRKHMFKRSLAGFAAITTMCAAMPVFHLSAAQTLAGDLNLDGAVSVNDVVLMQKYLFGKASLSGNAFDNANVCKDNAVNAFDMAVLKKLVLSDPVSNEVSIYLSDSGVTVEGDENKVVQISGTTAKITASGLYHVYGEITEGQILVETAAADTADVELELNDVTMTNSAKSCIYTSAASGSEKTRITLNGTSTLTDNAAAASSATTMDIQIPSSSNTSGNSITAAIWKTSVLKNDMSAEIRPLLSAVKNDEPKMANPAKRKLNEKM